MCDRLAVVSDGRDGLVVSGTPFPLTVRLELSDVGIKGGTCGVHQDTT